MENQQISQDESTTNRSTASTSVSQVCWKIDAGNESRYIDSNQFPNHATSNFPNANVTATAYSKIVDLSPEPYVYDETSWPTYLNKNFYKFGIATNGLGYNPMGLKPWKNPFKDERNWNWQAGVVNKGNMDSDAFGAHVASAEVYHYHGDIVGLALDGDGSRHSLIYSFTADGSPICYKYGYNDPNDPSSGITELKLSYQLKSGSRHGDCFSAPDDMYGEYIQDYEFNSSLSSSFDIYPDECNDRTGITTEYPDSTYYYVLTNEFPKISNCFKGTPNKSGSKGFVIGEG
ncbi:MAG: YHYH protein [Bacteroidota bacterium]